MMLNVTAVELGLKNYVLHTSYTDAVNSKYTHDVEARSRSINAACFKDRVRLTKDLYFPRCG